ncbi:MAG: cupin domain-containing protein [Gammaproteobacteria bacterium]|nr:cupin domain-containing protein [Gammaproteobacteria bacterium]NNL50267.1 cupin domain-containing protein [Woeseiaceae bacterium]
MTSVSDPFLLGNSIRREKVADGMFRQILGHDDSILMARVEFDKGAVGEVHAHTHAQVAYVVSGKFEVFISGKKKILGPGDGFYIQPNVDHGAVCLEPGVLIDVFSPVREDFLAEYEK